MYLINICMLAEKFCCVALSLLCYHTITLVTTIKFVQYIATLLPYGTFTA